ncbi:hypothetical protein CBS147339_4409 [Penicillium roqueforti]|uniref:Genomic scaffold, ProqFM164S01 n=1 Tax=Penicillium roqueforti (strain FM164) TaxID=1365484 RepID=W6PVE0_PENRF|nr:uncharacterized protein LCP9604111_7154 [Penicillium roqueforti]CDM27850.1 unnamed protein product [Penicillium roqueforti FM164]KAF9244762.1 hypothetical protein LCP9604111_7154 [Penicillium roqueforti]KAI2690619.1 hypothetical protein CBS147355_1070 [Penicillium roqueforti]KAI2711504.1 hypothetical protein CBS147318_8172 [Penicillium roqueforti]KAI2716787.1 hypothetical protein CBS147354_6782 [Penicillium roqueforti]
MSDGPHSRDVNPPDVNQGPRILIATAITTFAALFTVLARFYVRIFLIRNVGWDDYTMALTMLLSLCGFAIIVPEVIYGAGRHMIYVQETSVKAMHLNYATQGIYMWAIGLVKVSIGLFLLRFAPRKGYKVFIWVVIVLMTLYTAICFLTLIFECSDIRSNWDPSVKSKCFSRKQLLVLTYTNTALNILTDLIFAVLPVFMLRHLQVNRRVKASLICILGLGVFACAAAFVKLSILSSYGSAGDFLWDFSNLTIWVVTECNTGIIAGTLPTLKPLFKRFLGTYGSQSKTTREYPGSNKYKLHSMSRSRGGPLQSRGHKSGNLSVIEYDADPQNHRSQLASTTGSAAYAGSQRSNSSEERILPIQGEGIVRTTEVIVSREQNPPQMSPGPGQTSPRLNRMGSLNGLRISADDRV